MKHPEYERILLHLDREWPRVGWKLNSCHWRKVVFVDDHELPLPSHGPHKRRGQPAADSLGYFPCLTLPYLT